jgi:TRAP-type C4-dicarboxylate transport system permease small subunit
MKRVYEWICKNEMLIAKSSLGLLALLVFAAAVGRFLYPGFSYTWVTLSVPFGCALMLITSILKIKSFLRAIATGEAIEKREEGVSGEIL